MNFNLEKATELILKKLEIWYELIFKNLPNLALAIIIVIIFTLFAKLIRKITHKILSRSIRNATLEQLIGTIVYVSTLMIGVFIALGLLHLDKTVTSLLAGAGVLGLALGFAFQEIASNFVSGIFIAVKRPYSIKDIVEIEGFLGVVDSINLRTTKLLTFDGIEIQIPNKSMFTKPLKNLTSRPGRRLDISVGVSYSDDLEKAEKIAKEAVEKIDNRMQSKDVEIFFKEFGSSSINFDARVWVNYNNHRDFLKSQHQAIMNIKKAFDSNNITIPFPIRTLDFNKSDLKDVLSTKS